MKARDLADYLTRFRSGFVTNKKEDEEVIDEAEKLIKKYLRKKLKEQRNLCQDLVADCERSHDVTRADEPELD